MSLKSQNAKKKLLEYKTKKIVYVDNNEENIYEKIIQQDAEHDDNIDLDGVFFFLIIIFFQKDLDGVNQLR